jgi:hypothetical protein
VFIFLLVPIPITFWALENFHPHSFHVLVPFYPWISVVFKRRRGRMTTSRRLIFLPYLCYSFLSRNDENLCHFLLTSFLGKLVLYSILKNLFFSINFYFAVFLSYFFLLHISMMIFAHSLFSKN